MLFVNLKASRQCDPKRQCAYAVNALPGWPNTTTDGQPKDIFGTRTIFKRSVGSQVPMQSSEVAQCHRVFGLLHDLRNPWASNLLNLSMPARVSISSRALPMLRRPGSSMNSSTSSPQPLRRVANLVNQFLPLSTPEATPARPITPELDQWSGHGQLNDLVNDCPLGRTPPERVNVSESSPTPWRMNSSILRYDATEEQKGKLNDFVDVASRSMQYLKPQPLNCNSREPDTDYDDAQQGPALDYRRQKSMRWLPALLGTPTTISDMLYRGRGLRVRCQQTAASVTGPYRRFGGSG
ncbi:hypothetical protein EV715DRAFT_289925 [Schizophyllum commune]